VVGIIASPFIALVPVMAHHLAHGAGEREVAQVTGLLTTAQGAGAVAGALILAPLGERIGLGRLVAGSLVALPVALIGYATSQQPWWGAATLFTVGLVYIGVLSGLSTLVQLRAPGAFRGRILSFYLVALGVSYPIGSLAQGPVIDQIGVGWTTAGSAVLLLLVMTAVRIARPGYVRAITRVRAAAAAPLDLQAGPAEEPVTAGPAVAGAIEAQSLEAETAAAGACRGPGCGTGAGPGPGSSAGQTGATSE
jgi:MFS family permease